MYLSTTSWNIPNVFVYHMEIIYDVAKYFTLCHGIFCHVTCVICCGINNDLLALKSKENTKMHFIILGATNVLNI